MYTRVHENREKKKDYHEFSRRLGDENNVDLSEIIEVDDFGQ